VNETVFIVDDNVQNLKVLTAHLSSVGLRVLAAKDGQTAIERITRTQPDLVLLDVMMPGLDGFETCRQLKADPQTQPIPVILLTALTEIQDKVKGFDAGAEDFVTKPFEKQELLKRVTVQLRIRRLTQALQAANATLEAQVRARTAELQRACAQLALLDRKKTAFIAVLAHELRTPLTVIQGYGQMLGRVPEAQTYAAHLQEGVARMRGLIDTLLDALRVDQATLTLRPTPVALQPLVAELVRGLDLNGRDLTLRVGLEALPPVPADRALLRKALYHLVVNAVKYTPDGEQITVEGAADPAAGTVELVVRDTGIGIDPEHHELIFEKFYQTGEVALHSSGTTAFKAGGPGLGLAIAKGIVEAHGGRLWVESAGHDEITCPGSAFHMQLPLAE
jgi:signal transduction histidine kinase